VKQAKARILSINGGSASIKFALFDTDPMLRRILAGRIERSSRFCLNFEKEMHDGE
jgi:acetate kinase